MKWKLWYDIRARLAASLLFFALIAILHVLLFPFLRVVLGDWITDFPILDSPEVRQLSQDYAYYTTSRWFGEIERTVIFGILLVLGGVLAEGRSRAALITLSLPVSRPAWLLGQMAAGMTALVLLNLLGAAIILIGGFIHGQPVKPLSALIGILFLVVASAPYLAIALLASAYTGERLMAGALAFVFLIITNQLHYFAAIDPWMPESLMTFLSGGPEFSFRPVVTIVAVTIAAFGGAVRMFLRTEY